MRAVFVVGVVPAASCEQPAVRPGPTVMTPEIAAEFAASPERFKGKTLTGKMWCKTRPARGNSRNIRDLGGWTVEFGLVREYGVDLTLTAVLPVDPSKLADAQVQQDEVLVTFTCQEGKLDAGNVVVRITQ